VTADEFAPVLEIAGWRCTIHPESRSVVCLASGVGFACSANGGLWAITPSRVPMPPAVAWWLIQPLQEDNDLHY
jgi:hypothetical protein